MSKALVHFAREGDIVVVTAIDRLGCPVAEVNRTIAELGERRMLLRALPGDVAPAHRDWRALRLGDIATYERFGQSSTTRSEGDRGNTWVSGNVDRRTHRPLFTCVVSRMGHTHV